MKRIERTKIIDTLARSRVFICVSFFISIYITDEPQGGRFLSKQDAKQAVKQFELRTH